MRTLWRGAAAAALVSGTLTACASPHYPIDAAQAPGPAPLSAPKPKYPIEAGAFAPAQAQAAPAQAAPPVAAPEPPTAGCEMQNEVQMSWSGQK